MQLQLGQVCASVIVVCHVIAVWPWCSSCMRSSVPATVVAYCLVLLISTPVMPLLVA